MTMSQKGGLWSSVDLLSLEGTELLKADSNPSTLDVDSDLCLRSLTTTGTEKVAVRFIPPSTRYQFIEIDLISSSGITLSISASTESQAGLAFHGEIVVADIKITPFVLRTYRFPYLGEIESFVFSGFTSAISVNVKAIRFFTTPDRLVAVVSPETVAPTDINTAHLTVDGTQVARIGSIYQLDIPAGSILTTTAVFTFDTLTVSHGLIKILVSQQNHADVQIDVLDQTGLTTPYQLTTGYAEIFVTGEQKIVSLTFYNLSGAEAAHVCVELDFFQAIQPSNAFGTERGTVVSPLAGILEFICGGGSGTGTGGAPTDATYITTSSNTTLTNERVITGGTGITIVDNGPGSTIVINATGSGVGTWYYGNGEDGSATLDGTATVSWASKVGSVYTMTRSVMLINLTINVGSTLRTVGYGIYVKGTLTNNGSIDNSGGTPSYPSDITGQPSHAYGGSGNGVSTNAATANSIHSLGGAGGYGGASNESAARTPGGFVTLPTEDTGGVLCLASIACATTGRIFDGAFQIQGGAGGWGGQANTADPNGQGFGGSGGGVIGLFAKAIAGNGILSANGGIGMNARSNNCGGGGGGGGGVIFLITGTATVLTDWTITVNGGAPGNGLGTGSPGGSGFPGRMASWILPG